MIIWINGPFGVGKTQAAFELLRRLPGSFVYDPENAGYFIRKNIPESLSLHDFQDFPMWRSINLNMLDYLAKHHTGHIIVPMTVTDKQYYNEIIGALSKKYVVRHFILYAEKKTILKRLASRLESRHSWAARQIDRCINAFDEDILDCKIYTDHMSICQVVDKIALLSGITLPVDTRNRFQQFLDRVIILCRHIR